MGCVFLLQNRTWIDLEGAQHTRQNRFPHESLSYIACGCHRARILERRTGGRGVNILSSHSLDSINLHHRHSFHPFRTRCPVSGTQNSILCTYHPIVTSDFQYYLCSTLNRVSTLYHDVPVTHHVLLVLVALNFANGVSSLACTCSWIEGSAHHLMS